MAQPVKAESDTDGRYHSSGNTGRKAKPGVRSHNPAEHVLLGGSEKCITEWFRAEVESLSHSNHRERGGKKPCLGFRNTNIAKLIDTELSHLVVDQYSGQVAVELLRRRGAQKDGSRRFDSCEFER